MEASHEFDDRVASASNHAIGDNVQQANVTIQQTSPFLKLPAELRNIIYRDVLEDFCLTEVVVVAVDVPCIRTTPLPLLKSAVRS